MNISFDISKEKGGRWYAHPVGEPNHPVPGSYGDKRDALKFAAKSMGISVKDFLKLRKNQ